jgi:hypothetical protein
MWQKHLANRSRGDTALSDPDDDSSYVPTDTEGEEED